MYFEAWNRCHWTWGEAPPQCTAETVVKHSVIMEIMNTLSDACSTYEKLKIFNEEAAFLARYLYMFKRIFRQDKGIQQLAMVNQSLAKFRAYHAIGPIKRIKNCFPEKIPPDGKRAHLPTRQLLKWVLIHLMSNAKLFLRIIGLCKRAGVYIYGRLYSGWNVPNMIIALGLSSRILTLTKYLLIKSVKWYDRLRMHLPALVETAEFMMEFEFPKTMEDFIGYVDLRPPSKKADIDKIFELIDLTCEDEKEEENDIILMNEIINAVDSDSEIEIMNDVIIEEEKIGKKRSKRDLDDDVAVLYERTKESLSDLVPLKITEDLGEPVRKKRHQHGGKRHKHMPRAGRNRKFSKHKKLK